MIANLKRRFGIVMLALIVGIGVGISIMYFLSPVHAEENMTAITRQGGYQFINPLLSCDVSEDIPYSGYDALESQLSTRVDSYIKSGTAKRVSVYFRDMDTGRWTGVRPTDVFIPASLLKVPLFVAYLSEATTANGLLDKQLNLPNGRDENAAEHFKPDFPLARDQAYTVQQLLDAMIKQSDNNAATFLNAEIATTSLESVYENFSIAPSYDQNADNTTPQNYMRLFRILYNATYLRRTRAQQALETLSQTSFTQGLVSGVAPATIVSHKFGERSVPQPDGSKKLELHDCGIVYFAHHPYGICVMTEGDNFNDLASVIASISKLVYDNVNTGLLGDQQ